MNLRILTVIVAAVFLGAACFIAADAQTRTSEGRIMPKPVEVRLEDVKAQNEICLAELRASAPLHCLSNLHRDVHEWSIEITRWQLPWLIEEDTGWPKMELVAALALGNALEVRQRNLAVGVYDWQHVVSYDGADFRECP